MHLIQGRGRGREREREREASRELYISTVKGNFFLDFLFVFKNTAATFCTACGKTQFMACRHARAQDPRPLSKAANRHPHVVKDDSLVDTIAAMGLLRMRYAVPVGRAGTAHFAGNKSGELDDGI